MQTDTNKLKLRMLQLKPRFPQGFNYCTVYQWEFGKLNKSGLDRLRNCWDTKCVDLEILNRLEWMADNLYKKSNINKKAA